MTGYEVLGASASVAGLTGTIIAGIRWAHHHVERTMTEAVRPILEEMTHNGGASLKDQVVATRTDLRAFKDETRHNFTAVRRSQERTDRRIDRIVEEKK